MQLLCIASQFGNFVQDGSAVTGDLYDPHQQTFDQPGNAIAPRRMLWEVQSLLCHLRRAFNFNL